VSVDRRFSNALIRNLAALHAALAIHAAPPPGTVPFAVAAASGVLLHVLMAGWLADRPPTAVASYGYAPPLVLALLARLWFSNPATPDAALAECTGFAVQVAAGAPPALYAAAAGLACLACVGGAVGPDTNRPAR
jgi:hypothetical protein